VHVQLCTPGLTLPGVLASTMLSPPKPAFDGRIRYTVYGNGEITVDTEVSIHPEHPIAKLRSLSCIGVLVRRACFVILVRCVKGCWTPICMSCHAKRDAHCRSQRKLVHM
jgi:hypothetical protein